MTTWLTFQEVEAQYGIGAVAVRQLVMRGALNTKLVGRVQYFDAEDILHVLGTATADIIQPEGWHTYSDLYRLHAIKRGWLDGLVRARAVRYEIRGGAQVYRVVDVMAALRQDPNQEKMRWPLRG